MARRRKTDRAAEPVNPLIDVVINPLAFYTVDEPWASVASELATVDDLLRFLCTPGLDHRLEAMLARRSLPDADPALDALRRLRRPNVVPLEARGGPDGDVDCDWRVRVNVPLVDPDW